MTLGGVDIHAATNRLHVTLERFAAKAERQTRWMIILSVLIALLTAVMLWLTYEILQLESKKHESSAATQTPPAAASPAGSAVR